MTDHRFAPAQPARGVLRLAGEDRIRFLQGLLSNDLRLLNPGRALWAALLTPQGKFLHDMFLIPGPDESILIESEGARIEDLRRRLSLYRLRSKVTLTDVSAHYSVWVGWGPEAGAALGLAAAGDTRSLGAGWVFLDPRLTALGIRLVAPTLEGAALLAQHGFTPGDPVDWERLRLEHGIPDGSRDLIPEKAILLENGFDELQGVAWDKGCYIGQELTARTKYRGLVKKRLLPVRLDGVAPAPGTLILTADGKEAGEIRSGHAHQALALLRLEALAQPEGWQAGGIGVTPQIPAWARI